MRAVAFIVLCCLSGWLCGSAAAAPRILGGHTAALEDWPFAVALVENDPEARQFCGGTVISADLVLTAAHCVEDLAAEDVQIVAGQVRVNAQAARLDVSAMTIHPLWDSEEVRNDVAVLRTVSPLPAPPARLATPSDRARWRPGRTLYVAGWGVFNVLQTRTSQRLRATRIRVLPFTACRFPDSVLDAASMLCAGDLTGKRDSCLGDSGGPLVSRDHGVRLVGVVSFGPDRCAEMNTGGIYAHVALLHDWIMQQIAAAPPPAA